MKVPCPVCQQDVDVDDDVELSEVLICESCDSELEVVSIEPLTLAEFEEEEK